MFSEEDHDAYFSLVHKRCEDRLDPHIWRPCSQTVLDLPAPEPWLGFVQQADLCRLRCRMPQPPARCGGCVLSCHLVRCYSGLPASTGSGQRGQITIRCSVVRTSTAALPRLTTRSAVPRGRDQPLPALLVPGPAGHVPDHGGQQLAVPAQCDLGHAIGRMRMCAFYSRSGSSSAGGAGSGGESAAGCRAS